KDGLANYGMYADWLHDVQLVGGPQVMSDVFHGAQAYLEMWERAYGVPATRCLPARADVAGATGTPVVASFDGSGRLTAIMSTASGYRAGAVTVGERVRGRLPHDGRVGGLRYRYGSRAGRVAWVEITRP